MVHFNVGSRHVLVQPRESPINLDMPKMRKSSILDMLGTATRLGFASKVLGLGTKAVTADPRLTGRAARMALPDRPWRGSSRLGIGLPWPGRDGMIDWQQGRNWPWDSQRRMPWQAMQMSWPWENQRRMPWQGLEMAWPWQPRQRMPWQAGRRRDGSGAEAWQLLLAAAAGALLVYLLDPKQGNRRRKMAVQRSARMARQSARGLGRMTRKFTTDMAGKRQALMHAGDSHEPLDDATLAHKVESVLFRDPHVPKGRININSEHGIVVIRGEVDSPAEIRSIERAVKDVPGVQDVRSMLHLATQPAP